MTDPLDFKSLLESCNLGGTPHRIRVMEVVANSTAPLTAQEIYDTISRTTNANRVTVYRILDLLVEKRLLERISGRDRTFRYGLSEKSGEKNHPHFYCTLCGNMECLRPDSVAMDVESFRRTFPGTVENVEVRIDGVCKSCLKRNR